MNLLDLARFLYDALRRTDAKVDEAFPQRVADIVKFHSKGSAAAAVASGWVPGVGAMAATAISAGFIWTMYANINHECKIPFSENLMKSLASGVATNLASYVVGGLFMSTAFSLFPGIGSVGAAALIGGTCYALTLVSGGIYIKLLTALVTEGVDPTKVTEADLLKRATAATNATDVSGAIKDAKKSFQA